MKNSILIIDDFAMNLRLVNQILSEFYKVYIAKSGIKGFEVLKNAKVDLILLDLRMPEMPGKDFLTILKQTEMYKDIPVIIMSAKSDAISLKDVYVQGIEDFIAKPFTTEILLDKVNKVFNKKSINNEDIQKNN